MRKKKTEPTGEIKRRSLAGEVVIRFVRNKTAMFGLILLLVIVLACLLAPVIAPYGLDDQDVSIKLQAPSLEHIFGTDYLGRDVFTRILYGGRNTLLVGFVAAGFGGLFGMVIGSISGYFGGKTDTVIMRILDIFMSIPNLVLAICLSAVLGTGVVSCLIAVGISSIPSFARTMRGPILSIKTQEYIEAARSIDAPTTRIIFRHVVINALSPFIVQLTLEIARAITVCASLSFMGIGIVPPAAEWGSMLSEARSYVVSNPLQCVWPGLAIALVVIALNFFGDGLRDAMDPRLKN